MTDAHAPDAPDDFRSDEEFWDARYGETERIWSGNPNTVLVREVTGLKPGRALDLGCGEGGDAIWLARQGWQVTATDVSRVALERAARHAAEADAADTAATVGATDGTARRAAIAGRIDWQQHNLATSFPAGSFDLVSAHFLHSRREMPREKILRTAAAAVAPGGVLLIVGHAGLPHWETHQHDDVPLPTHDEVVASLELPEGGWEVLLSEEHERIQELPDGQTGIRTDNAVKVSRRPAR